MQDCMAKRRLLADLDLFRKLRPDELDRLVAFTRWMQPKARDTLFRKDDPGTSMMVVSEGRVKACTHSEDGKELVLNLFGPGEVFGEIALLDGSPRTADIIAIDACKLLVLDRRDFIPFLLDHPDASVRLLEVLTQRLRRTTTLLEDVVFREGPARLARRLVHLADFSGREVDDGIFRRYGALAAAIGQYGRHDARERQQTASPVARRRNYQLDERLLHHQQSGRTQ